MIGGGISDGKFVEYCGGSGGGKSIFNGNDATSLPNRQES